MTFLDLSDDDFTFNLSEISNQLQYFPYRILFFVRLNLKDGHAST